MNKRIKKKKGLLRIPPKPLKYPFAFWVDACLMRYKGHILYQATPVLQRRPEEYVMKHVHDYMLSLYFKKMRENSLPENDGFCISFASTTDNPLKIENGEIHPLPEKFKILAKEDIPTEKMRIAIFGHFQNETTTFRAFAFSDEGKALNIFPEKKLKRP